MYVSMADTRLLHYVVCNYDAEIGHTDLGFLWFSESIQVNPWQYVLRYLYYSSNIIPVIKYRITRLSWACSTYEGEDRCMQGFDGET